jgi:hypothetical protein
MGLNDMYSAVHGQILLMYPLPNIRKIYSLQLQEEKQRQLTEAYDNPIHAMNVKRNTRITENRQSTRLQNNKGKSLFCSHYEGDTNTVDHCYYIIGFPPGPKFHGREIKPSNQHKRPAVNNASNSIKPNMAGSGLQTFPQFTEEEYNQIRALLGKNQFYGNVTGKHNSKCHKAWIIDSGASDHISSYSHLLSQTPCHDTVHLPDGSHIKTLSVGNAQVNQHLCIKNVLHIPSFQVNLLSISKLTRDLNCIITFHSNFCILQDLNTMKMIGPGKEHNDLYYLFEHTTIKPP